MHRLHVGHVICCMSPSRQWRKGFMTGCTFATFVMLLCNRSWKKDKNSAFAQHDKYQVLFMLFIVSKPAWLDYAAAIFKFYSFRRSRQLQNFTRIFWDLTSQSKVYFTKLLATIHGDVYWYTNMWHSVSSVWLKTVYIVYIFFSLYVYLKLNVFIFVHRALSAVPHILICSKYPLKNH